MKIYKKTINVDVTTQIQSRNVDKMQKLIIVAALVACGLAAPLENIKETFQTADLLRPSPINPDIPSDPKPIEKVTLISDATEHPLIQPKAAVPQPTKLPGPYVPPNKDSSESEEDSNEDGKPQTPPLDTASSPSGRVTSLTSIRSKRADKDSSESDEDSSEEDSSEEKKKPLKARPLAGPSTTLLEKLADRTSTTPATSSTDSLSSEGTSSDADSTTAAPTHPRIPYSPNIHQHNEHLFKPTTEADSSASSTSTTTGAPAVATSTDHINDKRDIPVPLTRKHKQDDVEPDTAAAPKEEVKQEKKDEEEDHKTEPVAAAVHPATLAHPIPVAELFAKKPLTATE